MCGRRQSRGIRHYVNQRIGGSVCGLYPKKRRPSLRHTTTPNVNPKCEEKILLSFSKMTCTVDPSVVDPSDSGRSHHNGPILLCHMYEQLLDWLILLRYESSTVCPNLWIRMNQQKWGRLYRMSQQKWGRLSHSRFSFLPSFLLVHFGPTVGSRRLIVRKMKWVVPSSATTTTTSTTDASCSFFCSCCYSMQRRKTSFSLPVSSSSYFFLLLFFSWMADCCCLSSCSLSG